MSRNLRVCQEDWLVESIVVVLSLLLPPAPATSSLEAFFSMPCLSSTAQLLLGVEGKAHPHVICPSVRLSKDVDDTLDRSSLVFPPITISPHLLGVWLTAAKKELVSSWTSWPANAIFRQPSERHQGSGRKGESPISCTMLFFLFTRPYNNWGW